MSLLIWSMLEKVNWQKTLIQSAVFTLIAILIPLLALVSNFSPLQPVNAKGLICSP